ncbi:MAG TPA: PKD domain-containing protein [Baekduia sp.]|nr:PKD domain-containing protein [Baekduia sp.]
MRLFRSVTLSVAVMLVVSVGVASAATPNTARVSVSSSGTEGNDLSYDGTVSADGRFVAFMSFASNLVAGDANGHYDIFLRDRKTGQTTLVSKTNAGVQGDANSFTPRISADGRYVYFLSTAATLDADGTYGSVFRYDRAAASLTLLPMPAGVRNAVALDVSHDGTRIAFTGYVAGVRDVYWWDAATNQTHRASESASGAAGNVESFDPAISGDGKLVAFTSGATNLLTTADTNGYRDVFVKNLATGAVDRVSVTSAGGEANLHSSTPALSYDGCRAAFFTDATNLVTGQDSTVNNVLGRDRCTGSGTELLSLSNAGAQFRASAPPIHVSDNGCRVVFLAYPIAAAQMRDRCSGATSRLDVSTAGDLGNGEVSGVSISGGTGRYVAMESASSNLVSGDGNGDYDVFIRDLATNTAPTASLTTQTTGAQVLADAGGSVDPDGYVLNGSINWGDGSAAQNGLSGVHVYAHAGTYGVTVTVTDADGASASAISAVTVADAGAGGGSSGGGGPGGGGPSDGGATQLILDRVALAKSRFAAVAKGKKPDATHGTTLSLRLNLPATVTLTFERVRTGRKVKGRCKPGARKGTRCTRQTPDGTLTRALPAGTARIALTGVVGSKTLAAGTHRLTVRAKGADGRTTAAKVLTFTIVKAKKKGAK